MKKNNEKKIMTESSTLHTFQVTNAWNKYNLWTTSFVDFFAEIYLPLVVEHQSNDLLCGERKRIV